MRPRHQLNAARGDWFSRIHVYRRILGPEASPGLPQHGKSTQLHTNLTCRIQIGIQGDSAMSAGRRLWEKAHLEIVFRPRLEDTVSDLMRFNSVQFDSIWFRSIQFSSVRLDWIRFLSYHYKHSKKEVGTATPLLYPAWYRRFKKHNLAKTTIWTLI